MHSPKEPKEKKWERASPSLVVYTSNQIKITSIKQQTRRTIWMTQVPMQNLCASEPSKVSNMKPTLKGFESKSWFFKLLLLLLLYFILFYFVVKICKILLFVKYLGKKKTCFFHCHFCKIEKEKHIELAMVEEFFFFFFLTLRKSKVEPKGTWKDWGEDWLYRNQGLNLLGICSSIGTHQGIFSCANYRQIPISWWTMVIM